MHDSLRGRHLWSEKTRNRIQQRYFWFEMKVDINNLGKRELVALLNLSSWCLVMVEWLFLAVPWGCLRIVIVVFPEHTHFLFLILKCDICAANKTPNRTPKAPLGNMNDGGVLNRLFIDILGPLIDNPVRTDTLCWLFCCFTSQVNSFGHCGTVSSPNHIFSWASLNKRLTSTLCTYFRL